MHGATWLFGPAFSITFGVLSTIGQAIVYRFGIRPTLEYKPASRPRLTRLQMMAAVNRTVGYTIAGYLCSLIAHNKEHALEVGLRAGLALGLVTAVVGALTPFVEWNADRVPEKSMGVFGVGLILIGFTLQSLQYWVTVLDITVR